MLLGIVLVTGMVHMYAVNACRKATKLCVMLIFIRLSTTHALFVWQNLCLHQRKLESCCFSLFFLKFFFEAVTKANAFVARI